MAFIQKCQIGAQIYKSFFHFYFHANLFGPNTLGNKVEIRKIKATGSADRDFLVISSGHS